MLEAGLTALVVIDVQEKMHAAIGSMPPDALAANIIKLIAAAKILDIPILMTEQYPQGLGSTVAPIREAAALMPLVKTTCSCWRDEGFRAALQATHREHIILVGEEAHVCVQQTALDLIRVDYVPFLPEDGVGSRRPSDADAAFRRMSRAGVELTSSEAIIFELIERCDHPRFKDILKLVK